MDNPQEHLSGLVYQPEYSPVISRWFIFRFLTLIVEVWILWVWAMWIALNAFVHNIYMLFMGARIESIWKRQVRFMRHVSKWQAYLNHIVDQRPMWIEE